MPSHKIIGNFKVTFTSQLWMQAHFNGVDYKKDCEILLKASDGFVFRRKGYRETLNIMNGPEYQPASLDWMPAAKYPGLSEEIATGRLSRKSMESHKAKFAEVTGLPAGMAAIVAEAAKLGQTALVTTATKAEIEDAKLKVEDDSVEDFNTVALRDAVFKAVLQAHGSFSPLEIWRDKNDSNRFEILPHNESGRVAPKKKGTWVRIGVYSPKIDLS